MIQETSSAAPLCPAFILVIFCQEFVSASLDLGQLQLASPPRSYLWLRLLPLLAHPSLLSLSLLFITPDFNTMTSSSFDEHDKEAGSGKVEPLPADVNNVLADGATVKELDVAGSWLAQIAKRPDAAELLAPWTKEEERRMLRWKVSTLSSPSATEKCSRCFPSQRLHHADPLLALLHPVLLLHLFSSPISS